MNKLLDILLILIGTIIVIKSYLKIVYKSKVSIANYIILVIYVFCITPIIFNYTIGIPEYITVYWYQPFIEPMKNSNISIIYDIYILCSIIFLQLYSKKHDKSKKEYQNSEKSNFTLLNNKLIALSIILSPILFITLSGTWGSYTSYNTTTLRGFTSGSYSIIMNSLLLCSLFAYCNTYLRKKITKKNIILSILYFFMIIWISGKRFMIANIFILLLFYFNQMELSIRVKKKIGLIVPIAGIAILAFSAIYLVYIKPLSNTSFTSVYEMLRVDFGRDDVIKYVIDKEIIQDERILNYRGESFIGTIFMIIPRSIWPNKPYPHYRYLTSSILNLSLDELPAGTTPSWYELCIANFGLFGFIFAVFSLVFLCKKADKQRELEEKSIGLMLIVVLLTQSPDAYISYVLILFFNFLIKLFFNGKQLKFVWRKYE